jgi:universal stress protein F
VDLSHADKLEKALKITANLATLYSSNVFLLTVTASAPSSVAHNLKEFQERFDAYAQTKGQEFGVTFKTVIIPCTDPAADMDKALTHWLHENSIDLVVMASHVPSFKDSIFHAHGSFLAAHTDKSILLVR